MAVTCFYRSIFGTPRRASVQFRPKRTGAVNGIIGTIVTVSATMTEIGTVTVMGATAIETAATEKAAIETRDRF
jgi:hypothetical protein